jgi:WD40 repeat protein
MPDVHSTDPIREALHAAVDRESFTPMPSPVARRARRRLRWNIAISAVVGVAIAVAVAVGGSTLADIQRTTPADHAPSVPGLPPNGCCLPTESLVYQGPDGSAKFAPIDGQAGGTLLEGSQVLAATPDGSRLLVLSSDGYLGIDAGRHDVTPIVRIDRSFEGATIAPDGKRVAVATEGELIERKVRRPGFRVLVPVEIGRTLINPAWSPDGSRVAYIRSASGNDLMVLDPATGRSRLVLASVAFAAWAPDGAHLVVARPQPDFTYEIDVTDLQGNLTPVSSTPAVGFPAWSPGGSQIAFVRADGGVVIVDADGKETARTLPGIDRDFTTLLWVPGQGG